MKTVDLEPLTADARRELDDDMQDIPEVAPLTFQVALIATLLSAPEPL